MKSFTGGRQRSRYIFVTDGDLWSASKQSLDPDEVRPNHQIYSSGSWMVKLKAAISKI